MLKHVQKLGGTILNFTVLKNSRRIVQHLKNFLVKKKVNTMIIVWELKRPGIHMIKAKSLSLDGKLKQKWKVTNI